MEVLTTELVEEAANYSDRDPIEMSIYLQQNYGMSVSAGDLRKDFAATFSGARMIRRPTPKSTDIEENRLEAFKSPIVETPIPAMYGMVDQSEIVTPDILSIAIKYSIGQRTISDEDSLRMANHMLKFFGYNDRIIDNVLEPEDRDVFYMMEDAGILTTEREEVTLYDGREWRVNYWVFRRDTIQQLVEPVIRQREYFRSGMPPMGSDPTQKDDIYEELPEDVWIRN